MADTPRDELQLQIQYALMEKLSSTQALHSRLLALLDAAIFICDADYRLSLVNAAWSRQTEKDEASLLGMQLSDFQQDNDGLPALPESLPLLHDGIELKLFLQPNQPRWFELRMVAGEKGQFIGSLYDIDQRKQVEALLKHSERENFRLAQVALHTASIVIITDPLGRIEWVNDSFTELFGYTLDQVAGFRPGQLLQGPRTDPATVHYMAQCIAREEGFTTELVNYKANGEPVWVALSVTPVRDAQQRLTQFVGIETDITARVRSEQLMLEAQAQSARVHALRDRLLANVSHELMTPLTTAMGTLALMRADDADQASQLSQLESSCERLRDMLENLVALSTTPIASPVSAVEPEHPARVAALMARAVDRISKQHPGLAEAIVLNVDDAVPDQVLLDEAKLSRILLNLLDNACKFAPIGAIELGTRVVSSAEAAETLLFWVQDTGRGMPEDALNDIFLMSDMDAGVTRERSGAGLGLTVCKLLASAMNGHLSLKTADGQGFRVTLSVPLRLPSADELPLTSGLPPGPVLVVEDNKINQAIITRFVEELGYSAVTADHGNEALEQIQHQHPALVLMDIQMPVMDGLEATRQIRAGEGEAAPPLPVIGITADGVQNVVAACYQAGMQRVLGKPIDKQQLGSVLAMFLTAQGQTEKGDQS